MIKHLNLITVVSFSSKDNISTSELQPTDLEDYCVQIKKNTSWGHFSTGTFTPDREFYGTNQSLQS